MATCYSSRYSSLLNNFLITENLIYFLQYVSFGKYSIQNYHVLRPKFFKPFDTFLSSLQHFQTIPSNLNVCSYNVPGWNRREALIFEHLGSCFLNPVCKVLLNYSLKYNIDSIYRCVYMRHSLDIWEKAGHFHHFLSL